jgi:hypothetical protein
VGSSEEGRRIVPAIAVEERQGDCGSKLIVANWWLAPGAKEPPSASSAVLPTRLRMNV